MPNHNIAIRWKPGVSLAGLGLVMLLACDAPHDSIYSILERQREALRRLPDEDRARLLIDDPQVEPTLDSPTLEPGTLSLDEARRMALYANPDIHAARARIEAALSRIAEARSLYIPDVAMTHNSSRSFQTPNRRTSVPTIWPTSLFLSQLPTNPTLTDYINALQGPLLARSQTIETGNQNSFSDHSSVISATWTIFDSFVREARLMSSKHAYRASAMGLADVERLLVKGVDAAYFQAQLGREELRIARADEAFSLEQLDDARKQLDARKITKAVVLNFEVRVRAAQANVVAAQARIDTSRVMLAELMGLPEARLPAFVELTTLESETVEELAPPQVDAWLERAYQARPDLAQAQHTLKARAENIIVAKGQFGPEISIAGSWGFERGSTVNYSEDDQSSAMAIEFRWPIFTGGFRISQLRRARAEWWEAAAGLNRKKLEIASDVREAIAEVVQTQEQVKLQRLNIVSARENRRIVRMEYASGKASLVRLNEAQRDQVETEAQLARARIRLRQAWSALRAAAGAYRRPLPVSPDVNDSADPDPESAHPGEEAFSASATATAPAL